MQKPQYDDSSKIKNRDMDVTDMPEKVMDFINKGVGEVRTKAFNLD